MNSLLRLAACLCCLVMLLCITLPAGAARLERYLDPDKITSLTMTYRPNGVPLSGTAAHRASIRSRQAAWACSPQNQAVAVRAAVCAKGA